MSHGITYSQAELDSYPVIQQRPLPHQPIRALTAHQFTQIHLKHLLAHPQDGVLFPFLHGLEGSNHAQNQFFATHSYRNANNTTPHKGWTVPNYRGLVWVVCDEDLEVHQQQHQQLQLQQQVPRPLYEDEDELDDSDEDNYSDSSSSDEQFAMDVDIVEDDSGIHIHRTSEEGSECSVAVAEEDPNAAPHMHPVSHRPPLPKLADAAFAPHERRDSTASTTSSAYSTFTDTSNTTGTASTGLDTSIASSPSASEKYEVPPALHNPIHLQQQKGPTPIPLLTSTFRSKDLLTADPTDGTPVFVKPNIPDGISLRNFGIQVPIYATLSDIVVYSPAGLTPCAVSLAERFKLAIEKKWTERAGKLSALRPGPTPTSSTQQLSDVEEELVSYNVFVITSTAEEMDGQAPHLLMRLTSAASSPCTSNSPGGERLPSLMDSTDVVETGAYTLGHDASVTSTHSTSGGRKPNTIDFAQREKEEMRDLTRASEIITVHPTSGSVATTITTSGSTTKEAWIPHLGQVFLGNSSDVPLSQGGETEGDLDPFNSTTNDPKDGFGYDICIECHDMAPFPGPAHLRAAEDHLLMLEKAWLDRGLGISSIRPPPNANAVIHLPFPSSPPCTSGTMGAILPVLKFLERVLMPVINSTTTASPQEEQAQAQQGQSGGRRWSTSVPLAGLFPGSSSASAAPAIPTPSRTRSFTSPPQSLSSTTSYTSLRTRPLKILIYSSDGYTESSLPALCLLMQVKGLSLPEAYLELQVEKKRSFFVYQGDVGVLRRVEGRLSAERPPAPSTTPKRHSGWMNLFQTSNTTTTPPPLPTAQAPPPMQNPYRRPAANSISYAQSPFVMPAAAPAAPPLVPSSSSSMGEVAPPAAPLVRSRPRASTSPWLPSFVPDHQSWFNDHRFDGSFPSRVLPFLYLGNLNHASNAYMLHALGITHVVSVGECALVPPPHFSSSNASSPNAAHRPGTGPHFIAGKGPGHQGSLWIEEKEGRIKVLDIQGVCDDGIDTLEPQLEPICDWIEKARAEGGQVLVHCRVGVSRSATVTIAYVMKHLNIPLVDAYLIVRSRRLSVLIQPNMRLLYNLCGWEIKLAKERARGDDGKLRDELARTLTWPYLAKEVHALNEKYLR